MQKIPYFIYKEIDHFELYFPRIFPLTIRHDRKDLYNIDLTLTSLAMRRDQDYTSTIFFFFTMLKVNERKHFYFVAVDCTNDPCINGAVCENDSCNCPDGYTGLTCWYKIPDSP